MRQRLLAASAALCTVIAAFAQADQWRPYINAGAAAEAAGDYARAATSYRAAAELSETFEHGDRRRALSWNSVGTMYDAMARFPDAAAAYRRALKAAEETGGKASVDYALALGNLGSSYAATGQLAAGETLLRESLAIYSAVEPRDEVRLAAAENGLAEVLSAAHRFQEAGALFSRALDVFEKSPGSWLQNSLARNNLAVVRWFQGQREDAWRLLVQSLTMMEEHVGMEHPMLIKGLSNLATLASRMGQRNEAGERLRRALHIAETRLGTEHPVYAAVLANYAAYLRDSGDKPRAKELKAQAAQIMKDAGRRNGAGSVVDIRSLRGK